MHTDWSCLPRCVCTKRSTLDALSTIVPTTLLRLKARTLSQPLPLLPRDASHDPLFTEISEQATVIVREGSRTPSEADPTTRSASHSLPTVAQVQDGARARSAPSSEVAPHHRTSAAPMADSRTAHAVIRPPPPPPLTDSTGATRFLVKAVLDHRVQKRRSANSDSHSAQGREYLVRWRGYGSESDTWEPRAALLEDVPCLVQRYETWRSLRSRVPRETH